MKKKKQVRTPKRKRLNRKQRIPIAKNWVETYKGKNIVKGYSNWFGVDLLCAITELRMVGENISLEYETKVRKSLEERCKRRKRAEKKIGGVENASEFISEWDSGFEFIAGYTSNGVPFGIRKQETNKKPDLSLMLERYKSRMPNQ